MYDPLTLSSNLGTVSNGDLVWSAVLTADADDELVVVVRMPGVSNFIGALGQDRIANATAHGALLRHRLGCSGRELMVEYKNAKYMKGIIRKPKNKRSLTQNSHIPFGALSLAISFHSMGHSESSSSGTHFCRR